MVRLVDIARELGINASTVSRALTDHPRISLATRERVKRKAEAMGYVPDPALKRLSQRRWVKNPGTRSVSLAGVAWSRDDYGTQRGVILNAAEAEALRLGFGWEMVFLEDYPDGSAAARVLEARGVAGIVAVASRTPDAFRDFPFGNFCGIEVLAGVNVATGLSLVRFDEFGMLTDAGERILALAPESAGIFLIRQATMSATDMRLHAASLAVVEKWREAGMVCEEAVKFGTNESERRRMNRWVEVHRPEMLVVQGSVQVEMLNMRNRKRPILNLHVQEAGESGMAGYLLPLKEVGIQAVRQLDSGVRMGLRGIPEIRHVTVIPGVWQGGSGF